MSVKYLSKKAILSAKSVPKPTEFVKLVDVEARELFQKSGAGNLIVFEGIDGTGKGTMLDLLFEKIEQEGLVDHVYGTSNEDPIDLQIREMLFEDPGSREIDAAAIDALFLAGHLHRTSKVIRPKLASGVHVVCDRYWQSAVVYPLERHGDPTITESYLKFDWPRTSLLVSMTCDPKVAFERANGRGDGKQEEKAWNKIDAQALMQRHFLRFFGDKRSTLVVDTTHLDTEILFETIMWPRVASLLTPTSTLDKMVKHFVPSEDMDRELSSRLRRQLDQGRQVQAKVASKVAS